MPTIEQIRAARALIGWSQGDLAEHAGLSQTGIARIENGTNHPNSTTLDKIRDAFDKADVEFIDDTGVTKRPEGKVTTLYGHEGFVTFLKDVYETLKETDDRMVVVNNVSEDQFLKWEEDYAETHEQRMASLEARYKIIVEEGDSNFTASQYAEYRWVPSQSFSNISYYIYANVAALIYFTEEDVKVYTIQSKAIADFFREEFDKTWRSASTPITKKTA